jgi:hypothetical protein
MERRGDISMISIKLRSIVTLLFPALIMQVDNDKEKGFR